MDIPGCGFGWASCLSAGLCAICKLVPFVIDGLFGGWYAHGNRHGNRCVYHCVAVNQEVANAFKVWLVWAWLVNILMRELLVQHSDEGAVEATFR